MDEPGKEAFPEEEVKLGLEAWRLLVTQAEQRHKDKKKPGVALPHGG